MRIPSLLLCMLFFATPVLARDSTATNSAPKGFIESKAAVTDPDFGIHVKALGLERHVEMLQWRKSDAPAPAHYVTGWVAGEVDSRGFDAKHRNPGDLPFNGARWWSTDARLDGHPVTAAVLGALGAWSPMKPDPAQLPANLAATFQPDGDGLSSSQDPKHPRIGDVRVRWRVIERAAAPTGTVLVDGRWDIPETAANPAPAVSTAQPATPSAPKWWTRLFGDRWPWLLGGGVLLALALLVWRRSR